MYVYSLKHIFHFRKVNRITNIKINTVILKTIVILSEKDKLNMEEEDVRTIVRKEHGE